MNTQVSVVTTQRLHRRSRRRVLLVGLVATAALVLTGCNELFAGGWGNNSAGQLGNNSTTSSNVPVPVDSSGVLSDSTVTYVDADGLSSCAATTDGLAACWGRTESAGGPTDSLVPVEISSLPIFLGKFITQVEAGEFLKCALTSDGSVGCWGYGGERILGGALTGQQAVAISTGNGTGCAVTASGGLVCWGANDSGQVGDGTVDYRFEPVAVDTSGVLSGQRLVQVSVGAGHTCAVTDTGATACWGSNLFGELGTGSPSSSAVPVAVDTTGVLAEKTVSEVSAGSSHTCARTSDDDIACWGFNGGGQLGNGTIGAPSNVPVSVVDAGVLAGQSISRITAGGDYSCALLGDKTAACWGANQSGQLGDASFTTSSVPVAVAQLASGAVPMADIDAGALHTMAIYEQAAPTQFVPITPVRVVDTRLDYEGPLDAEHYIVVDGSEDVPPGTTAVAFNITATGQTASGYLEVAPDGAWPGSSTINWGGPQQTIANGFVTKLSAERKFQITLTSPGTTHVVLDVTGYFAPAGNPDTTLYASADRRIYDSRTVDGPLPAGQSRTLNINTGDAAQIHSPQNSVASSASVAPTAAAVNVTVTGTTGSGVLTVAKSASSATSTINWSGAAQTVANAVITDVAPDGSFTVTNNGRTATEVVVDLTGTFAPTAEGATGAQYYAIDPVRPYDSRSLNGPLAAGTTRTTTNPVPFDAQAVAVNTTITGSSGTGFVAVTPPTDSVPATSTVNWFSSPTTRANGSVIPVDGTALQAYTGGNFSTEYLYDVAGYFK